MPVHGGMLWDYPSQIHMLPHTPTSSRADVLLSPLTKPLFCSSCIPKCSAFHLHDMSGHLNGLILFLTLLPILSFSVHDLVVFLDLSALVAVPVISLSSTGHSPHSHLSHVRTCSMPPNFHARRRTQPARGSDYFFLSFLLPCRDSFLWRPPVFTYLHTLLVLFRQLRPL